MILGALAAGSYHAALYALDSPALRVREVVVDGNRRLSSGEAAALLDGLKGERILTVDLERWREQLRASSWVADAELRRRLPSTIEVRIVEREPMGIARFRDALYLIGAEGGVIDEFGPRYADLDLPVIDGLLIGDAQGSHVDDARSRLVADLMTDIRRRPDVARRVSQIDVTNAHDLHVILEGDPAVIRLGDSRFLERIWSYVELQASLRQRVPAIDYVDLRFDDRVYVGPSPTVVAANAAAGTASPSGQSNATPPPASGGRQ